MSDNLLGVFGISESDLIQRDKDGKPVLDENDAPIPLTGTPRHNEIQKRLGPVLFKVYLMRSFASRIERDCEEVLTMCKQDQSETSGDIKVEVNHILEVSRIALTYTESLAKQVPAGFKPAGSQRGAGLTKAVRAITVDAIVSVKADRMEDYAGIFESEDDHNNMKVVSDTGTRVWCRTKSGDKLHLPKKDLEVSG